MDKALAAEERTPETTHAEISMRKFCVSWRRVIFDGSRVAFIIFVLVFVRAVPTVLEEIRLLRTQLVEQSTSVRMAIQLQGREISKNLHALDVNSSVLIDRFDIQSTHLRGQMKDVATTAAIASKEERKQIVQAIQGNNESQKEPPAIVVPEVQVVPIPQMLPQALPPAIDPPIQKQEQAAPAPQPLPEHPQEEPAVQRKGNRFKRLLHPLRRIF